MDRLLSKENFFVIGTFLGADDDIGQEEQDSWHHYYCQVHRMMSAERQDNLRSWRNFLSMSKSSNWLELRKYLMPWTLPKVYSKKYLFDAEFRKLLLEKMNSSYHQLSLNFDGKDAIDFQKIENIEEILSNLHDFKLSYHPIKRFPKIRHIYHLNLSKTTIKDLSSVEDVQRITLTNAQVVDFHHLKNVKTLHIFFNSFPVPFIPLHHFQELIELETFLDPVADIQFLSDLSTNFLHLKRLTLHGKVKYPCRRHLHSVLHAAAWVPLHVVSSRSDPINLSELILPPQLKSLALFDILLDNFQQIEERKHSFQLKSLKLGRSSIGNGLTTFIPQLKELMLFELPPDFLAEILSYSSSSGASSSPSLVWKSLQSLEFLFLPLEITDLSFYFPLEQLKFLSLPNAKHITNIAVYPKPISTSQSLSSSSSTSNSRHFCGEMILNLQNCTSLREIEILSSFGLSYSFHQVNLISTEISDLFHFQYVNQIYLDFNKMVSDITPIANVPFLSLRNCPNILDFNCLFGKRIKYLDISHNHQITNKMITGFSEVISLNLSYCASVSDVSPLTGNYFLYLTSMNSLREVVLKGLNYVKVIVLGSTNPGVIVEGKVIQLEVSDRLNVVGKKNVEYLISQI